MKESAVTSTRSPFDLTGRTALVTGGNQGLGRAFAFGLAEAGATVARMKIVSGQYSADGGSVSVQGTHLALGNPRDAVRHGVAIVPQELASIEDMTVYENLFVGRELRRGPFLNRRAMIAEAKGTLSAFDVAI